ncbi:glycine zipper 2TM domain-containing protein [Hahella ganghwensis]|uniref:glycine zipper 2TM domain-containing protein n=1 Tax=Hahella ganghwensis TaxID=286420 RepID=UPI000369040D|nr:glycine zipper 2TM domain-containing protein [Hahella ganghwensis]
MKAAKFTALALALSLSLPVLAHHKPGHHNGPKRPHGSVVYARVMDVEPIVNTREQRVPVENCWTEQVRHEEHVPGKNQNYTGTVLGGVIGGAVGHAVGHKKRNKQVGAAVGALLGAAIGHDVSQRSSTGSYNKVYYTNERRCDTTYDVSYYDETVGYWVTYQYDGQEYRTRMDQAPGDRIRVRVTVEPF